MRAHTGEPEGPPEQAARAACALSHPTVAPFHVTGRRRSRLPGSSPVGGCAGPLRLRSGDPMGVGALRWGSALLRRLGIGVEAVQGWERPRTALS
jgi:hypothetical protein